MDELLNYLQLQSKAVPIGGGDTNQAYRVTDGERDYFLKYHPQMSADFFQAEVGGLEELSNFVRVPKVFRHGTFMEGAFILMEWIEPGEGDQKDLAHALSKIHRVKADYFGYKKIILSASFRKSIHLPETGGTSILPIVWRSKLKLPREEIIGQRSENKIISYLKSGCIKNGVQCLLNQLYCTVIFGAATRFLIRKDSLYLLIR